MYILQYFSHPIFYGQRLSHALIYKSRRAKWNVCR